MPFGSALMSIGMGLAGDIMSKQGQEDTNAMQMAIAQKEMDWQTQMSNTAMQRRVEDYKAAGLNPMLAAGGPGASMGSPVMPNLQNPNQAFGQLGGQVTNALQLQQMSAQTDLLKAQADKTKWETGGSDVYPIGADGKIDWEEYARSGGVHSMGNMNAVQLANNMQQTETLTSKIAADVKNVKSQTALNDVQVQIQGMNKGILQATYDWAVKQAIAEAKIDISKVPGAQVEQRIMSSPWGVWIGGLRTALGIAQPAANTAAKIGSMFQ